MNRKFCDRCDAEVYEYAVVSVIGKNYSTLTTGTDIKKMKDMEMCPKCSVEVIEFCQKKS